MNIVLALEQHEVNFPEKINHISKSTSKIEVHIKLNELKKNVFHTDNSDQSLFQHVATSKNGVGIYLRIFSY